MNDLEKLFEAANNVAEALQAKIDYPNDTQQVGKGKLTPIEAALYFHVGEAIRLLVNSGIEYPDAENKNLIVETVGTKTALHNGFLALLSMLKERKVNQQKISHQIGSNKSYISNLRSGKNTVTLEIIEQIANAFCISVEYKNKTVIFKSNNFL